jgi:hypothetical protein
MNQDKETDIIVLTFRSQTINKKGEKKKGGRRGCKKIKEETDGPWTKKETSKRHIARPKSINHGIKNNQHVLIFFCIKGALSLLLAGT